ncbi:MAG: Hsp20/alpha crystallin family protein [Gammaproteobacteria bacterium]|nr:Hsp20/alpha crystallin family protein [Gammaproteobacteria bacterium]
MVNSVIRRGDHWGRLGGDFDSLLSEFFRPLPEALASRTSPSTWAPAMDVTEDETAFVLRADLPGVEKDAIEVSVHEGVLTISGESVDSAPESQTARTLRSERRFGKFERAIRLGRSADAAKVNAVYRDGVLEVRVPKLEAATPRKVPIELAA